MLQTKCDSTECNCPAPKQHAPILGPWSRIQPAGQILEKPQAVIIHKAKGKWGGGQ
jgi:hypothetical protein